MRLYADVNFDERPLRQLQRQGVDVLLAKDDGRGEAPDPELLDCASALDRVLLTHDDDFLVEAAHRQRSRISFVRVVYSRQGRVPIGKLVADLLLIAEATDEEYWQSRVELLPL